MIRKIFLFILLTFNLTFIPKAIALEPPSNGSGFATSYEVLYDVDPEGVTSVSEKIILRNLTPEYYANQFKLTIGATDIFDIKASDEGGALEVQSEQKDTSTILSIKFNQQVVGKDKKLNWTLQFKSKDFAQKSGKIWEVKVPKVSATSFLENYNLTIAVPTQFGEPTLISPTPKSQTSTLNKFLLTFDKSQLLTSGVSASFGSSQAFDFILSYYLENNKLLPIFANVILPSDTAYQDVLYQKIDPVPLNVTVDNDGNYLAWYKLTRGQRLEVLASGSAKLYTSSKVKNPTLESTLRKKYTSTDKYWDASHPQIKVKLAEILGSDPPKQTSEKAKLIYRFVVDSLQYDSSRLNSEGERLGALTVLTNTVGAVSMEFTDLFIALARAAGIPSRELNGYAYTQNNTLRPLSLSKDILHSWVEYWDDTKGWVMVDPTWENTTGGVDYFNKLDLNHFVFITKGSSSTQPLPKKIKVMLSENNFSAKSSLEIKIDSPNPIWSGFPGKIKVTFLNTGNASYPSSNFNVTGNRLVVLGPTTSNMGVIPPFGKATFDLSIRTKTLFDNFEDSLTVTAGSQRVTKNVSVKPFLIFQTVPFIASLIASTMVGLYVVTLGGLIYRKRILKRRSK